MKVEIQHKWITDRINNDPFDRLCVLTLLGAQVCVLAHFRAFEQNIGVFATRD